MKYVYPVLFTKENNLYNVSVPDLPGCFTFGETLPEAIEMARDAICMWLCDAEDKGENIPKASLITNLSPEKGSFYNLIDADTLEYRKEHDNKAVKKTLTIPSWLNARAEKEGVNFSQVLQDGLKRRLGL